MLENEKYYGTYIYNRENGKRKKNRVLLEHFDEVRNETAIPAIITKAEFDKVKAILEARKSCRPHQNANPEYFLTGFVQCKSCGSSMSGMANSGGRGNGRIRSYACPNHGSRRNKVCATKKVNAVYLETLVKKVLTDEVNAYLYATNAKDTVFSLLKQRTLDEAKSTQKHIDRLEDHINGLINQLANTKIKAIAERCEAQASESIGYQEQHKTRLAELNGLLSTIDEIEANFKAKTTELTVDDLFTSNEFARELVGLFIEKIIVDDKADDIEIIFKN